jgi:hypothetical protein
VALILVLSGCAATSEFVGVREPDLNKIQMADQRSQVEQMLGKRLWRLGSTEGSTYDVYQYKAAQPARPGFGVFALIMDTLTLGMIEYNAAEAKKFWPVKQVAVAYDEQDRVRFLSQPWSVSAMGPCRRMRSIIPAISGVPSTVRPSTVAHQIGAASAVAVLELDKQIHVAIDGHKIEGQVVELPPGRHAVSYSANLGGSVLYGAMILTYDNTFDDVELLPGRHYRLKRERFYPGWEARADAFWIEDVDSAETLQCAWPGPE